LSCSLPSAIGSAPSPESPPLFTCKRLQGNVQPIVASSRHAPELSGGIRRFSQAHPVEREEF
jgi:hypothetical protein